MIETIEAHTRSPDFNKLKSELINHENGISLYEDPHFPAKFSIVFGESNTEFDKSEIIWRRPDELSKEPCLLSNFDADVPIKLYRGKLTPFWFPVLIGLLKENDMLDLVVPNLFSQNTFDKDSSMITPSSMTYCGAFQFCFRRGGILENVIVDDFLPTTESCHLLTTITSNSDEFLPALIEKAYAKFLGGYYKLERENFFCALMDFTGGLAETLNRDIHGNLTMEEMDSFYRKIIDMVGSSFTICQVDQESRENHYIGEPPVEPYQFYKVTGYTELPMEAPDGIITDLVNTIYDSRGDFIPALRILPLIGGQENSMLEKHVLHDWHNSTTLVKKKYGLEFNNSKENWIYLQNLLNFSKRVVIIHMFYRSSIVAIAKKQPYWKYTFFENFWHRDCLKGKMETIGNEFLKNQQYLLSVTGDEGCSIKIMLTNIQKYIDVGANAIQFGTNVEMGITILEVEKNRQYRIHDLEHTVKKITRTEFQMGRYLVVSANLEGGKYVIIPWISEGAGIKYTIQIFSSTSDSEIIHLDLDIPRKVLCNTCQIKRAAYHSPNKNKSLSSDNASRVSRKPSSSQTDLCQLCRSLHPKRATRISVIGVKNIALTASYQLPNFLFKILCEDEVYTSKILRSSLSPRWNEHFLFYRVSDTNSQASIQLFCETKLGFKSTIFIYSFSETELRDKNRLSLPIGESGDLANETDENRLIIEIQNYFLSEFNLA